MLSDEDFRSVCESKIDMILSLAGSRNMEQAKVGRFYLMN